jgi:DNA repair protein RadC
MRRIFLLPNKTRTIRKGFDMQQTFTLRDVPAIERPRERLLEHGMSALSSQEVLALILGRGTKGLPVMMLAQSLMHRFGSPQGIRQASLEDLCQVPGMGLAKAAQLQACMEIARRSAANVVGESGKSVKITDPAVVADIVRRKLRWQQREHYVILCLDARKKLICADAVSIGTLDSALVHPRETFETAINHHAASVVVSHNHPSNDPMPSDDDLAVTKRLVMAGRILGISVLDHVIVARDSFYSLQEHGQI